MCCSENPHGRAMSIVTKFNRMFGVKAFVSDNADKEKWEKAGVKIEGGYDDFFEASDFVMVGTPATRSCLMSRLALPTAASSPSWAAQTGRRF